MVIGIKPLSEARARLLTETIGTFYLVLVVSITVNTNNALAPFAIGFMLMTQVFAYGYIGGGMFNPAVTAAVAGAGFMSFTEMAMNWAAQLVGGLSASFFAAFLIGDIGWFTHAPTPVNDASISVARAFCNEWVFTSALASVVLNVACSKQKDNSFFGLAIGMVIMSSAMAGGAISGGAYNPAVATSLQAVLCVMKPEGVSSPCRPLAYCPMYWATGLCASLTAVVVFKLITVPEEEEEEGTAGDEVASSKAATTPRGGSLIGTINQHPMPNMMPDPHTRTALLDHHAVGVAAAGKSPKKFWHAGGAPTHSAGAPIFGYPSRHNRTPSPPVNRTSSPPSSRNASEF